MILRGFFSITLLIFSSAIFAAEMPDVPAGASGEYGKHFAALSQLSIAVSQAMPADHYGFRPHPDSMTFGQLMSHIAATNYQFCAGLKDSEPPAVPPAEGKDAIVKFLSDSFAYCTAVIPSLDEKQLEALHNSPDGRLSGRAVLLVMYIHVAHHRGQAEIYLRDNGIAPPRYMI